jgi:hypothetical protein
LERPGLDSPSMSQPHCAIQYRSSFRNHGAIGDVRLLAEIGERYRCCHSRLNRLKMEKIIRSTLCTFTKQTIGRTRRRISTKHRSITFVVRNFRQRVREHWKNAINSGKSPLQPRDRRWECVPTSTREIPRYARCLRPTRGDK